MKKVYLLLASACVVASASAADKDVKATETLSVPMKAEKLKTPPMSLAKKAVDLNASGKAVTRAGEPEVTYFRAANNVMSVGMSSKGYGLNGRFGFGSTYGDVVFNSYCLGVESQQWNFSEVGGYDGEDWIVKTSSEQSLSIKSAPGEMMAPTLTTKYASGAEGQYETVNDGYLFGGSAEIWFGEGDEKSGTLGVTFYQNFGLDNPEGYNGDVNPLNAYYPGNQGWNENGVYNYKDNPRNWEAAFSKELGTTVSNLRMESYMIIQPKPASTYFFTTAWIWVSLTAKSDTQLLSYVYPIDEEGEISETPIALGYAAVSKGENSMIQFYYNPLDENGDELEGEIFVDSAVAISIEGFNGNPAVQVLCPVSGFYPFHWDIYDSGNRGVFKAPSLYMNFAMEADGETVSAMTYDGSGYYFDQREEKPGVTVDKETVAPLCYAQLMMDAMYAYIHSADGVESVTIPLEGGSATTEVNALFYNINLWIEEGIYVVTAPEWLAVSFGESDQQTGNTTMTVSAEAGENRTGVVTLEGLGATYSLTVNQGEGAAVSTISIDKNAQYFDLQGRRVANPEKGIFIKKSGNKAEKVIL